VYLIKFGNYIANDRGGDANIIHAFQNLVALDYIGNQCKYLACFAKMHPSIELSIHKDDKAALLIDKYGSIKTIYAPYVEKNMVIDKNQSTKDIVTVIGKFRFPLYEY